MKKATTYTKAQMSYYEKLKDPRWQRKRLEVMERVDFRCVHCDASEKTLSVHHTYYEKGLSPWEYPPESLRCLCEDCHEKAQDLHTAIQRQLGKPSSEPGEILGFMVGLELSEYESVCVEVSSYEMAEGMARGFGWPPRLDAEDIIDALEDGKIDGEKMLQLWERKVGLVR